MVGDEGRSNLSAALLAAQNLLVAKRQQQRLARQAAGLPVRTDENGRFLSPPPPPRQHPLPFPGHLGWHSPAVTAALRLSARGLIPEPEMAPAPSLPAPPAALSPKHASPDAVKVYPDVALGMLRRELAAAGRVWLLLRHLDIQGRGWLDANSARQQLTQRQAPLRICGSRQWRNLMEQGEGVFWQQQNGRIWLRSVAKVAAALGVWRLAGRPVALPLSSLTQGMGQVRAHLYASFHSGRQKASVAAPPIARATLHQLTQVQPRTQRRYERQARVRPRPNFAVGQPVNQKAAEETAWQQGTAVFRLTDGEGRQGRKGVTYLAWQLPNQYAGPHPPQPRGRQKRINRELADLFMQGMTGNSAQSVESNPAKRFYGCGKTAGQAAQRKPGHMVYWPALRQGRQQFWHMMERGT